jgi:hypothetical protein
MNIRQQRRRESKDYEDLQSPPATATTPTLTTTAATPGLVHSGRRSFKTDTPPINHS